MPVPYEGTDESSVEAVGSQISLLPDDVLDVDENDEIEAAPAAEEVADEAEQDEGVTADEEVDAEPEEAAADDTDEQEQAEAEAAEDMVEIDGEEVPLSQLVEQASAYRETQAQTQAIRDNLTREANAQLAAALGPVMQERQSLIQALQNAQAHIAMPDEPDPALLDASSRSYNPDAYHRQLALRQKAERERTDIDGQLKAQQDQLTAERAYATERFADEQKVMLVQDWPEWDQEDVQMEFAKGLNEHYQLDPQTLGTVLDHRFYKVARDALAYQRMKANGKKPIEERPSKAPPRLVKSRGKTAVKSAAKVKARKADAQLAKSGKLADAAKVFERFVD